MIDVFTGRGIRQGNPSPSTLTWISIPLTSTKSPTPDDECIDAQATTIPVPRMYDSTDEPDSHCAVLLESVPFEAGYGCRRIAPPSGVISAYNGVDGPPFFGSELARLAHVTGATATTDMFDQPQSTTDPQTAHRRPVASPLYERNL